MKKLCLLAIILALTSCAGYRPIVDLQYASPESISTYEENLKDCQRYADQISPAGRGATGAVIGGVVGGLLGLAVGLAFGVNPAELAGFGAAVGGIQGAAGGVANGGMSQVDAIRQCLAGRGYRVLQ